eukprot:2017991-Rhodomonas_salina.6
MAWSGMLDQRRTGVGGGWGRVCAWREAVTSTSSPAVVAPARAASTITLILSPPRDVRTNTDSRRKLNRT